MIVCHCFRVSDREIRHHAEQGARSVNEVGQACGAGMGCGGCREQISIIVDEGANEATGTCMRLLPILQATG
jgi:bacterioferritin-associated ferredoxin